MNKTIKCISRKPKKKIMHKYKCILVLNNHKRSKYFKIINMPSVRIPKPSKILDNYIGIWKPKTT